MPCNKYTPFFTFCTAPDYVGCKFNTGFFIISHINDSFREKGSRRDRRDALTRAPTPGEGAEEEKD